MHVVCVVGLWLSMYYTHTCLGIFPVSLSNLRVWSVFVLPSCDVAWEVPQGLEHIQLYTTATLHCQSHE